MKKFVSIILVILVILSMSACSTNSIDKIPYDEFGMYIDSELKASILDATEYPFSKINNAENTYFLSFNDAMETKRGIKITDTIDLLSSKYDDIIFNIIMPDSSYEKIRGKDLVNFSESHDITLISYSVHVLEGKIIDYFGNEEKYSGKEIAAYVLSFNIESNNVTGISLLNGTFIAE